MRSIISLMGVNLEAPDHTTLSRRGQRLSVGLNLVPIKEPIYLIVESTGLLMNSVTLYGSAVQRQNLSIVGEGEGEWAAAKYGRRGKRAWKKLHLGVDRTGMIVAQALTHGSADDARTALDLIDSMEDDIESLAADAAYDTNAIYDASAARRAEVESIAIGA